MKYKRQHRLHIGFIRTATRALLTVGLLGLSGLAFSEWAQAEPAPVLAPLVDMPTHGPIHQAPQTSPAEQPVTPPAFNDGVRAYREGNYIQARKLFSALHKQYPENTKITYYLAITEAQLARFQQARKLYEEIITLDPNGKAAQLAQEGLMYLPSEMGLDLPPRFQDNPKSSMGAGMQTIPGQQAMPNLMYPGMPGMPNNMAGMPGMTNTPGVSPQDMMALQMLMGQSGGSGHQAGGGGFNPMSLMMMQGMMNPNDPNGAQNIDPSTMSNMLMNQMMQDFNFGFDSGSNR